MTARLVRSAGAAALATIVLLAVAAPWVATADPKAQHRDHLLAPPMPIRMVNAEGQWTRPFVYPLRSTDRLEHRFEEVRSAPMAIRFFTGGRLVSVTDTGHGPWLPLGADRLGRDGWSRLVYGARLSLAVAVVATSGAMLLGLLVGLTAAMAGGLVDALLMRLAELVQVLPVLYIVLGSRAVLPQVLSPATVFLLVTSALAALGWAAAARGVRAIALTESTREYVSAARAAGAGPVRIAIRHLLPATYSFLRAHALLLVPAAILAETTLSFVGMGFEPDRPSWGTLLQEASDVRLIAEAPWLLSAAAVIVVVVLAINLLTLSASPTSLEHATAGFGNEGPQRRGDEKSGRGHREGGAKALRLGQ